VAKTLNKLFPGLKEFNALWKGKEVLIPLESKKVEDARQEPFQAAVKTMGKKRRDMDG
jgi:hypothetical protein